MGIQKLRTFVEEVTEIVSLESAEAVILAKIHAALATLLEHDDWLPELFTVPHADHYQQYLLHCDPLQRFSVVSFVWGPGQKTPVHDHTIWGLIGVLRGAEISTRYTATGAGSPLKADSPSRLEAGNIDLVSPLVGDIHQVSNAFDNRTSISIHVYGGNIGAVKRHAFDINTGQAKEFTSSFSSTLLPNIWV